MFQCGACNKNYQTNGEVTEYMKIHDNAITAAENDPIIENDEKVEQDIVIVAKDMQLEGVTREAENHEMVDIIGDTFIENAFEAMNPDMAKPISVCDQ